MVDKVKVGFIGVGNIFPQYIKWSRTFEILDVVAVADMDEQRAIGPQPVDVLAQSIVAEVACRDWDEDALYEVLRRAWPYAGLTREQYTAVLRMLAEGYTTRRGPTAAYLHRDAVHRRLRGHRRCCGTGRARAGLASRRHASTGC